MRYADPAHSSYQELRERYRLEQIVSGAPTQFDQLLALSDWLRGRWAHGWDGTSLTTNGLQILKEADEGKEFHCWYFTMAFCACAAAIGHVARPLAISKADTDLIPPEEVNISHVISEVWSNDFGKWIVIDPDLNCHYVQDGLPLSAHEIRRAWLSGERGSVKRVCGKTAATITDRTTVFSEQGKKGLFDVFLRYDALDYYHYLRFMLRTDLIAASEERLNHVQTHATSLAFGQPGLPAAQWVDGFAPPQIYIENHPAPPDLLFSSRLEDVYWTLNQAEINVRCAAQPTPSSPPVLRVSLDTVTPDFDRFEVQLGSADWEPKEAVFDWPLEAGENTVQARPVTRRGLCGMVSGLAISYLAR